ncbi:MFS transporter [Rhodocaloribacter litoris]|uniref:MFS transporter n=1 Tax=Rhodocaloribacter litoris TaxID=2558931 RepID=UPI00141F9A07|nr:MFS transporter [Rhodocaloribacter litoris]QXD15406.1 MFS transporter [Rhodocaloribacter litoris]
MRSDTPPPRAGFAQGAIIIGINLLPMMAIVALMPVVPAIRNNFAELPGIETLAPLVLSAPGLCVALFSPLAGFLTDRLGRRKLLMLFTFLYGAGGILPFFVESFPAVLGGRFLLGIGEAFVLTIGNALLGDYFDEADRAKWLMWQGILGSACGTLLLSLSGYLSTLGWNYPFLVYAFAFAITGGAFLFIYEPRITRSRTETPTGPPPPFPLRLVLRIGLFTLMASALYFVYTFHFALALDAMGITDRQQIGNYSAVASIAVPIGAILFKLISGKSSRFQFACLFCLVGLGLIGIGLAVSVPAVVAAAWIQQLGAGMAIPVLIAWGLREVPPAFRGRGMGFWASGFFLGQFLSPLAVSAVRDVTGNLLVTFVVFGTVCLAVAAANLFLSRREVVPAGIPSGLP